MQLWYANRGQNTTLSTASRFVSVVCRSRDGDIPRFLRARFLRGRPLVCDTSDADRAQSFLDFALSKWNSAPTAKHACSRSFDRPKGNCIPKMTSKNDAARRKRERRRFAIRPGKCTTNSRVHAETRCSETIWLAAKEKYRSSIDALRTRDSYRCGTGDRDAVSTVTTPTNLNIVLPSGHAMRRRDKIG